MITYKFIKQENKYKVSCKQTFKFWIYIARKKIDYYSHDSLLINVNNLYESICKN